MHADELTPLGGAELAARLGAVSADHLLCITDAGIDALAASGTVATLLPGTAFFLRMHYAPARKLIERGVTVALASDCNPGTCPTENLPLVGTLACTQMRMLPAEVVAALTLNAAAALGLSDRVGSLEAGKQADLIICDVPDYRQLFYHFGVNHVWHVIKRGRVVFHGLIRRDRMRCCSSARTTRDSIEVIVAVARRYPTALPPGRAVLVGFPQDEGVRRNGGGPGRPLAPAEIRRWLGRLTPCGRHEPERT